ncbi:MAG: AAA family ATPase, partial [Gammaproteobacteria bacterium]|nr:AAA family ATPase [Gammaproteobacteria bacterium]
MLTVVASLKGGSGKSTVTFNLAVWLAMAGIRVRAFDLDPQATLSDVIEVRQDEKTKPALSVEGGIAELLAAGSASAEGEEILVDVGTADIEAMNAAVSMADRVLVPVQPSQ